MSVSAVAGRAPGSRLEQMLGVRVRRPSLPAAILLVSSLSLSPARAVAPVWTKQIGQYRIVKWSRPSTSEHSAAESILIRDRRGREVARITGNYVEIERVTDLTGDGFPDFVVRASKLGAHGPVSYYVFSLGRRPRCLLAYYKKNIDSGPDSPDFEVKDLDGDGRKEILSWYDGFAYWDAGGDDWSSSFGGAARVPVVLGLQSGRYVDVTERFRGRLRARLAAATVRLRRELKQADGNKLRGDAAQAVIECYTIAVLLRGSPAARRMVVSILPKADAAAFLKIERRVRNVVNARRKRCVYPRTYGRALVIPPQAADLSDVRGQARVNRDD